MLDLMRKAINQRAMCRPGDLVLVAVSGGPDSVALVHALHRLSAELSITLHLFHLNHGLRGSESEEDAQYVRMLADRLALPATLMSVRPDELRNHPGGLQAGARAARYREMEAVATQLGAACVALGHNMEDQAETVLMRLLRGTGSHGLAGIPPVRRQKHLTYIRPLLGVSRAEIDRYCTEHGLEPRHDASNRKPDYLRNRIRLELIPHLRETYNPALVHNLADMAAILREENIFLDQLALEAMERSRAPGEGLVLQSRVLLREPLAISRRLMRLAARELMGPEYDLPYDAVERILQEAADDQGSRALHLPGGLRVFVEYDLCRMTLIDADSDRSFHKAQWQVPLSGEVTVTELGLRLQAVPDAQDSTRGHPDRKHMGMQHPDGLLEALLDLDALPGPLLVRTRRPGDRIWPVGMEGSQKLQDILVDQKLPRRQRDRVPVLVAGDQVVWAIGYRLDRRFLAGPSTQRRLLLRAFLR